MHPILCFCAYLVFFHLRHRACVPFVLLYCVLLFVQYVLSVLWYYVYCVCCVHCVYCVCTVYFILVELVCACSSRFCATALVSRCDLPVGDGWQCGGVLPFSAGLANVSQPFCSTCNILDPSTGSQLLTSPQAFP